VKRFTLGQRVIVHDTEYGGPMARPMLGTVVQLRVGADAWIELDHRVEGWHHPFPADDTRRGRHVLAFPEDCEPAPAAGGES
jgi:hypothetical protein